MKIYLPLILGAAIAASAAPQDQFGFAGYLADQGQAAAAVVEYHRFIFFNPLDERVADAKYEIARIQLADSDTMSAACGQLRQLSETDPGSAAGRKAAVMLQFVEANAEYDYGPLRHYLAGDGAAANQQYQAAVSHYGRVYAEYPKAQLADDAMLAEAKLLNRQLGQAEAAQKRIVSLLQQYPQTPLRPQAELEGVVAVETVHGPTDDVVAAYRKLAEQYANDPVGQQANERLQTIKAGGGLLERSFDKRLVGEATVKYAGYPQQGDTTYIVEIVVPGTMAERELQATMEDALLAHYRKRSRGDDGVKVTAFFTYPGSKAGELDWRPGAEPAYKVFKRDTEDVVKDIFFNILKKR